VHGTADYVYYGNHTGCDLCTRTLCPVKNGPPRHRAIKMSNLNEFE